MTMEGFNFEDKSNSKKEGAIDSQQLLAEVNQLARSFVAFEDDNVISSAVESDEFKTALMETAQTNPERLVAIREKLDSFLKQRENIAQLEEELSKTPEKGRPRPEDFDFKKARQKLLEDRSAIVVGEEIGDFFRHPVVSYFTNLFVKPETRKKLADTYQETVTEIRDRVKKETEQGLMNSAVALLPIIKAMNEEKRFEIKKEFFGAQGMREALMKGADSAILKEVEENGEESAREIFGDEVFGDEEPGTESDSNPSFEEVQKDIKEKALQWLRENLRVTFDSDIRGYDKKSEQDKINEFKRIIAESLGEGIDLDTAKDTAEEYIADLSIKSNFTHAQNLFAYKIINMIRNFDGKL